MERLRFDTAKTVGDFKPMNAVNNGPVHARHHNDQYRDNFELYRAAKIPFARNHDAAFCSSYGGQYSVDITAIFNDFDADVNDPASYDFACTDEYIAVTLEAGTETFYRLGEKIEHEIRKHHIHPPKDYQKWAQICEHIIRHYNEGWADGYHYNIRYWEIWNEADLDAAEGATNKRTWSGTREQFFELYTITAKHLKACFPEIMIGGPALAHRVEWAEEFLTYLEKANAPLDFFSWHVYCRTPERLLKNEPVFREMLNRHGYTKTQSILNEWNYVLGWEGQEYTYSIKQINGLKGASFALSCMCCAQKSTLDMLMYYDARPSLWNGLFDFYTLEALKGYYPYLWYGMLYGRKEIRAENEPSNIYTLCGVDENGKTLTLVTHYDDNDDAEAKTVSLDFGKQGEYEVYLLDAEHDGALVSTTSELTFTLPVHTCLLIKEK